MGIDNSTTTPILTVRIFGRMELLFQCFESNQDDLVTYFSKAFNKGVDIQVLTDINILDSSKVKSLLPFAKIRHVDDLKVEFLVVDSSVVYFPVYNHRSSKEWGYS